ncbi:MAG: ANTAR domain-containing protein [Actinomycetota bacterium]
MSRVPPDRQDHDVMRAVGDLTTLLLTEESLDSTLEKAAEASVRSIPSADAAGISLVEEGHRRTTGATDEIVGEVDSHQYETGEGPCLDSIRESRVFIVDSMEEETRWPSFSPRAVGSGILSAMSAPLSVRARSIGALNVYSRSAKAFGAQEEEIARGLAEQVSVVLANAHAYDRARALSAQLEDALQSNRMIGAAVGILMEREKCTEEKAFDVLRKVSQNKNMKLRDVALQLLDSTIKKER